MIGLRWGESLGVVSQMFRGLWTGVIALGALAPLTAVAEDAPAPFEYWPGARYDTAIPTFEKMLGYAPGTRITRSEDLAKYCDALAASMPDRALVRRYGRSWEGRELVYLAIGSAENIARFDEISRSMKRLADPRAHEKGEADRLVVELPVLVWLTYGVHGDEISSCDAALLTAYHLLAAQGDALADEIRQHALVFILPSQNPDGRARFVHHFEQTRGQRPEPDPLAAEHNEPWPSGRFNHYLFDMNRDWFAQTQPEIYSQAKEMLNWYPQVVVDLHEMGADETYYFAPPANPINPLLTKEQREGWDLIGRNNARWFDQFGFDYFTREVFDEFYPGYADSWPALHGAIAMTYEQASPGGLEIDRRDGDRLTYRDAVQRHFVASLSTAQAAAQNRERLLREFVAFRRSAIEDGKRGAVREYVLVPDGNRGTLLSLASKLQSQGIDVRWSDSEFRGGGETFPAGSQLVALDQPAGRLARNLLEPHIEMDETFVAEQERRRAAGLPDQIYDVTAWSLPLAFNVRAVPLKSPARIPDSKVESENVHGVMDSLVPKVAYLVPWGDRRASLFLSRAFERGWPVWSADKSFRQGERTYPRGTLILKVDELPEDIEYDLPRLAREVWPEVYGTDTSWVDEGVNFGSEHVVKLKPPKISLAWDRPTSPTSAGAARHVLEAQYGLPVTIVRTQSLVGPDLDRFDVAILPDGGDYKRFIGDAKALTSWVDRGGTLIAIGGAVEFLVDKDVGLLEIQQENAVVEKDAKDADTKDAAKSEEADDDTKRVPGKLLVDDKQYKTAIRPVGALPDPVAGALLRATTDRDHWITVGLTETIHVLAQGRAMFTPIKLDEGVNAVRFAGPAEVLASGHLWEENRKQYAYKPFCVVQPRGRGFVIAFTADPNFRGYMDGLNVLFLNAVVRGPAHATPAR